MTCFLYKPFRTIERIFLVFANGNGTGNGSLSKYVLRLFERLSVSKHCSSQTGQKVTSFGTLFSLPANDEGTSRQKSHD